MERIRYGMVGGGEGAFIGAVHRMAARLDDAWQLVCGAFSSDAQRSLRSGAELGLPAARVYENYARMMAIESVLPAEERMQVVVIVTPNREHLPIALAAFERGFHVLSDKPATGTVRLHRVLATTPADRAVRCGIGADARCRTPRRRPASWS